MITYFIAVDVAVVVGARACGGARTCVLKTSSRTRKMTAMVVAAAARHLDKVCWAAAGACLFDVAQHDAGC